MSRKHCNRAGSENQKHQSHLMAFPAKLLATQSVPKLVQDLNRRHGDPQEDPIVSGEELFEGRQFGLKLIPLHQTKVNADTPKRRARMTHQPVKTSRTKGADALVIARDRYRESEWRKHSIASQATRVCVSDHHGDEVVDLVRELAR